MNFIGQFTFVSHHGRLLQAFASGEMRAVQEVENVGDGERWNVYAWPDGKVSLQNARTNRWLCADERGRAVCDRAQPLLWEQWKLFSVGNGTNVALQSTHGTWLCAEKPGDDGQFGGDVISNQEHCGEWEHFSMIPCAGRPLQNRSWWNAVSVALGMVRQLTPIAIPAL